MMNALSLVPETSLTSGSSHVGPTRASPPRRSWTETINSSEIGNNNKVREACRDVDLQVKAKNNKLIWKVSHCEGFIDALSSQESFSLL